MASVQRKLVHKQFNSPIGLYSDNNVKATLNRELKVLSNGTMGIDFDDSPKPANLANSAVLRMLEEEENQKRHGRQPDTSSSRKCRSRICDVDRDTVLRINRKVASCRRHLELSWPPRNKENTLADKIKFSEAIFGNHDIKDRCEKFDKPQPVSIEKYSSTQKECSFKPYSTSLLSISPSTTHNKNNTTPIIITDIEEGIDDDNDNNNCATNNNHNNDATERINKNPTSSTDNRRTSDNKIRLADIDSIETIKPFCDRKIATINSNNNCPCRSHKDQGKALLKRSKSYDNTFSNIIDNEINNRKNTNLHFIGYCEWLRCSSYNELASLKWKNDIFSSENPKENVFENGKTMKLQVYRNDKRCGDDNVSGNKYRNIKINLISPELNYMMRPIQSEYLQQCCECNSWCPNKIPKSFDCDGNRFSDENSKIDIEKSDLICCNTSNHIGNLYETTERMGCIRHGNESENICSFKATSIMEWPKRRSDNQNDGGLKRVAWPPEPEYQSPSRAVPQPQQSPAQGDSYHQPSQNQYPSQYNNNARQQSHDSQAVEQRSPYQQDYNPSARPQPIPQSTYQQQNTNSYPIQQPQPVYQQQYSQDRQPTPVDVHPQPVYQRQHSQSQPRQSRLTPGRFFNNPDPCFMKINKPACVPPPQPASAISPSTSAFVGGVVVNAPQQSLQTGYANGGASSPYYQQQSSPNYQQHPQSSPNYQQQSQSSPSYQQQSQSSPNYYQQQPQSSPQYQSNSSLPLSPDPNYTLPGWSPVRKPVQVQSGYTLNNQRQSAEPSYGGQSYTGNQNQFQQQSAPTYQQQYQPPQPTQPTQPQYQPPQQQYQPTQQQQYQSTTSNEQQYQAQQPYYRQPSPGVITLRKEAPFNQQPAPVFTSQPAAASFGGGTNMRGDQKWPPQEYKLQSEIDNEARRRLAQGPLLRPRRVQKDYSQYFNQHALNPTYPGYRAPPGTQHFPAQ